MTPLARIKTEFVVFQYLAGEVCMAFNTVDALFADENRTVLADAAVGFFQEANDALSAWGWLRACHITDPAQQSGRANLSVPYFDEQLRQYGLASPACVTHSARLMSYRQILNEARDRILAHADRDTIMRGEVVGAHDRKSMTEFVEDLQLYCDAVADAIGADQLEFRFSNGPGDCHDLLKVLRAGMGALRAPKRAQATAPLPSPDHLVRLADMATTSDSSGERRLARVAGNVISVLGQAMEDGTSGLVKRTGALLRDCAAMPFLAALGKQAREMVGDRVERLEAPETHTALAELVDDLDSEVPDQRRMEILRRAFLAAVKGDASDPDGTMALAFMQVARKLTGLQAAILSAGYVLRDAEKSAPPRNASADNWKRLTMEKTGIKFPQVFHEEVRALAGLMLLFAHDVGSPRTNSTGEVFTDFGLAFCEFLARVEPFENPAAGEQ